MLLAAVTAAMLLVPSAALADPAFGPGNGGGGEGNSAPNGPADPKCHPPGINTDTPGCK